MHSYKKERFPMHSRILHTIHQLFKRSPFAIQQHSLHGSYYQRWFGFLPCNHSSSGLVKIWISCIRIEHSNTFATAHWQGKKNMRLQVPRYFQYLFQMATYSPTLHGSYYHGWFGFLPCNRTFDFLVKTWISCHKHAA